MPLLDMQKVMATAKTDPEFTRETRYLSGIIKIDLAGDVTQLSFSDGALTGVSAEDIPTDKASIAVGGSEEQWRNLLADKPKPFYHSLQSACVRHGMTITDTHQTFAYLPAINRLIVLMREHFNKGGQ